MFRGSGSRFSVWCFELRVPGLVLSRDMLYLTGDVAEARRDRESEREVGGAHGHGQPAAVNAA